MSVDRKGGVFRKERTDEPRGGHGKGMRRGRHAENRM